MTRGLRLVGRRWWGGQRCARCPASVSQGPVPGWPVSGASLLSRAAMSGGRLAGGLACWLPGWPVIPLGISALAGPRAFRSAIGTGAPFRCGRPSASSVAPAPVSTLGSSRHGWAGGAAGAAAWSFIHVAEWVWPSGTGAGLGCLFPWPASVRVLPFPSAAAPRAAGVPPWGCGTPVGSPCPGVSRGASAGTMARTAPALGAGWGPGDCQMALLWAVLPVRLVGLGVDGVPVWPAPGLVDGTLGSTCRVLLEPRDWGSRRGCGRGGAWCRGVGLVGCGAGWAPGWPVSGPLAGGRVWTRRVAFGVVDQGCRQGPGPRPVCGAWCRGVARVGRLLLPCSCGWACFPSQRVVPGAPGLLWPRGAAAGVVVPPVWVHALAGRFMACRPPMVPERL